MVAVIAGYARTPFSKFNGHLASLTAAELGAHAIRAALLRAGIEPTDVQRVVAGQVLQAGAGQNPARQSAVLAGLPLRVPATTLNVVCLSGSEAVATAVDLIERGVADVVLAVGQESMSSAPHALVNSRSGKRYGAMELIDIIENDGLTDAFEHVSMGASTERDNGRLDITRADQDALAVRSHRLAHESQAWLAGEIEPLVLETRTGPQTIATDDGVRPGTTREILEKLRPAFSGDGTITAGNASQITDGAAALVLMSADAAVSRGVRPLAEIVGHALVAGPDSTALHSQPSNAITAALTRAHRSPRDLVAVEINEAFAAVVVQSTRDLGIDEDIVNRHGGAIALGHPIGASGARLAGTLARDLADLGPGALGAVGLCGGGGQGSALILRSV